MAKATVHGRVYEEIHYAALADEKVKLLWEPANPSPPDAEMKIKVAKALPGPMDKEDFLLEPKKQKRDIDVKKGFKVWAQLAMNLKPLNQIDVA